MTAVKTQVGAKDPADQTRFDPVSGSIAATNVQDAIEEVDASAASDLAAHVADVDPHPQYLTAAEGNAAYQPLNANLTSWAAITRAAGFDTFVATPSLANLGSLLTNEAAGVITFLTTPSSANLRSMLTDETGTGAAVFADTPELITPILGVASATSVSVDDDAYAAGWNGSTLVPTKNAVYDKIELVLGTTLPATYQPLDADLTSWAGVTRASGFDTFAATPSSANLRSLLTDETGTGALYFAGGNAGTPSAINLANGTALPLTGLTGDTTTALGIGSINLGHASDTTLSRSAAGVLAVEGIDVVTVSATQTLDNKTMTSLVVDANSSGTALRVTQVGSGDVARFEDDTNPDSTPIIIDNSGKMIIGHTANLGAPFGYPLQVVAISGGNFSNAGCAFANYGDFANASPDFRVYKSRASTIGGFSAVQDGDSIGRFRFYLDDGVTTRQTASFGAEADGTASSGSAPGRLTFSTTPSGSGTPSERMRINNAGWCGLGETSDANMTIGLTINQAGNDDHIFALKSSDVAHGVTTILETDTYFGAKKFSATDGGTQFQSLADTGNTAFAVQAIVPTASTTKSTAGRAAAEIEASLVSGTGVTTYTANGNMLAVRNNGTTRFILDADGDSHQDVGTAWTNFDFLDDVGTLNAIAYHVARDDDPIKEKFNDMILANRERLQELGLVSFGKKDNRPFMNMSKLTMLHTGAIRQLAEQTAHHFEALERRLSAIEHRGTA